MHRFFVLFVLLMLLVLPYAKGEEIPVRLHVIADSNDETAQEIKMKVKDKALEKALEITSGAKSAQEAYAKLFPAIGEIRLAARETAAEWGFTGEIEAEVTREYFPCRLYGNLIVKEGEYPTVLVRIGKAEGKNWWCVIYPDLCLYGEKTDSEDIRFYSKIGLWMKRWRDRWSV